MSSFTLEWTQRSKPIFFLSFFFLSLPRLLFLFSSCSGLFFFHKPKVFAGVHYKKESLTAFWFVEINTYVDVLRSPSLEFQDSRELFRRFCAVRRNFFRFGKQKIAADEAHTQTERLWKWWLSQSPITRIEWGGIGNVTVAYRIQLSEKGS